MTPLESTPAPECLGLKPTFGFGDRLGLAGPGHLASLSKSRFLPILAQQSVRELTRTGRTAIEVMQAAKSAIQTKNYSGPWGADADHLKTPQDVVPFSDAGYTFYTIDPSDYVNNDADNLSAENLQQACLDAHQQGAPAMEEIFDLYFNKTYEFQAMSLAFDDPSRLRQSLLKYGRALTFSKSLFESIKEIRDGRPFEVEISVDETDAPTTPLDHLFIALEIKRLGIEVVSLAPRFIGDFEKGVDYRGDLALFERDYRLHAEIARTAGPYKISIHSGSDKFSAYPIMARHSGDHLHVKTAGTSYLEALRVLCRREPEIFRETIAFARQQFKTDRATYHISANLDEIPANPPNESLEDIYLNQDGGRQVLHVTFGSCLTSFKLSNGRTFKEALLECLNQHPDDHEEVLILHLGKHLKLLES